LPFGNSYRVQTPITVDELLVNSALNRNLGAGAAAALKQKIKPFASMDAKPKSDRRKV
jgi:hypothetical protein